MFFIPIPNLFELALAQNTEVVKYFPSLSSPGITKLQRIGTKCWNNSMGQATTLKEFSRDAA